MEIIKIFNLFKDRCGVYYESFKNFIESIF